MHPLSILARHDLGRFVSEADLCARGLHAVGHPDCKPYSQPAIHSPSDRLVGMLQLFRWLQRLTTARWGFLQDLREQLASRGLDTAGTKSVLMERLERALETTAQPAAQQKLVGNSNAAGNPEEEGVNAGATGSSSLAKKQSAGFKAKKSAGQQSAAGARFAGQGAPEKENGTEADGANAKLVGELAFLGGDFLVCLSLWAFSRAVGGDLM